MNTFTIGERVELVACPDFPGTVIGFMRGKVQVRFDDFKNPCAPPGGELFETKRQIGRQLIDAARRGDETEERPWTRARAVEALWTFASRDTQESGTLVHQVRACKMLWETHRHEPALRRLSEIAAIEASRTKGDLRAQQSAQKLLTRFLKAIKPDKNQKSQ